MAYSGATTTLFFTYLLFMWMTKYLSRIKQITLLVVFYLVAHLESIFTMHVIGGASMKVLNNSYALEYRCCIIDRCLFCNRLLCKISFDKQNIALAPAHNCCSWCDCCE